MPTIKELDQKIEAIKNNHLAHMAEDIDRIEVKVDKMDNRLWAVLLLIIASVVGFVFKEMM
jgi:uncharacterized protein Yka (UPF0111/DUF47 family)